MKGKPQVIEILQEVLKAELTAINQYFVHAEMCENWGYYKLARTIKHEAIDEMKHAERLIQRILFLEATPNMSDYFRINIGETVKKQFENDLAVEMDAVERLNRGIRVCVEQNDNTSRELLETILKEEEEHVDFIEAQLHMIGEMGLGIYLTEQTDDSSK